jgi:predicted ATPase/DNA-binding winged helix-turn-helix (wHTH) protein
MDPMSETPAIVEFGRFRILPHRRAFLVDGRPIRIGGRAFDVLMALIEARGALLSKDVLMSRVWPNRNVEENALQAQISALRDIFGADRDLIRTVRGRGYLFTGDVRDPLAGPREQPIADSISADPALARPKTTLAEPASKLVGRDVDLREVARLSTAHRLLTLTGAGGIGKTRLARAGARHLLPQFADGVWIAELAPLSDPGLVPATVAKAVGLELPGGEISRERVANALARNQILLVLDNCEHVIDAAAGMVEELLRASLGARVIATSREPLRAEGEWLYVVPPLSVPPADEIDVMRYGAVQLFAARMGATDSDFSPDGPLAATVAAICRRLDGIPLAIELAASRAALLGIEELAARLDDRFRLLTGGRRTALPRHQTLLATLDWSYDLLPESERIVLRRLAIFAGAFPLEAAIAIAASTELPASDVIDCVTNLVAKSLVTANFTGAASQYLLLETTRAYALERLTGSGELEETAGRHVEYHRDLFERAEAELETRSAKEWLAAYGGRIDDVRVALDWAFAPSRDASVGVALTAASAPLWMHLSLLDECRERVERAISVSGPDLDPRLEMQLYEALGRSLAQTRSPLAETIAAWQNVLELAEKFDDTEYRLRALWGLYNYHLTVGNDRACVAFAERFRDLAAQQSDPTDLLVGHRMIGTALHFLGNQSEARRHIEHMLDRYVAPVRPSQIVRFEFDQRVLAQVFLSRILWFQGFPEQAFRMAQRSVEAARTVGHPLSLCIALADAACLVGLGIGDLTSVEANAAILLELSAKHGLPIWNAWARGINGAVLIRRGDVVTGLGLLRSALNEVRGTGFVQRNRVFSAVMARGLLRAGQAAEGLSIIDEAFAQPGDSEEHWYVGELLRVKGELLLLEDAPGATVSAELHFRRTLDCARRQGALSWELRAATSLARLWQSHSRSEEARELLAPIYDRFTEGFDTSDLKAAKSLIDDLSQTDRVIRAH